MNSFKELAAVRRSHRQFTEEKIGEENLKTILRAALMAPTGKGLRKWSFAVTENKEKIKELSEVRPGGSAFLAEAAAVVAVMGNPAEQDIWVEDGSIAAVSMQYQAADLGLGSCWCQIRNRESRIEGITASQRAREILGIEDDKEVLCLIGMGYARDERKPQDESALRWDRVRIVE